MPLIPLPSNKLRYLICGQMKGGTHFVARFLTERGYPCGHERVYWNPVAETIETPSEVEDPPAPELLADCSYAHYNLIHAPGLKHLPLIMLVRNPYDTLNSRLRHEFAWKNTINLGCLMKEYLDRFEVVRQSRRVELVVRIEHDLIDLCRFLGLRPAKGDQDRRAFQSVRLARKYFDGYPASLDFNAFAASLNYPGPTI